MATGENNWNEVGRLLGRCTCNVVDRDVGRACREAITLCRRMAAGELVERSSTSPCPVCGRLTVRGCCAIQYGPNWPTAPRWEDEYRSNNDIDSLRTEFRARLLKQPAETPAPKTSDEDEDERRHAIGALLQLGRQFDADMEQGSPEFSAAVDLLMRERSLARAEGRHEMQDILQPHFDARSQALTALQSQLAEQEAYTSKIADRCAALSARLKRVTEAARAVAAEAAPWSDSVRSMLTVLAEVEGKNGGGE
jgi:uncharacterized coiled-coil protein SlyX